MAVTMFHGSVPVFLQMLGGLKGVLEKAETQAAARKFDAAVLMNWRLYPDMFPLVRQVHQACHHAYAPGRIAGTELPKLPDADTGIEEMKGRIDKTIAFLQSVKPEQLDGHEDASVTLPVGGQPRTFRAQVYLFHFAMPNLFFHTTTAYDILRHVGIEIGKRDFMGQVPS